MDKSEILEHIQDRVGRENPFGSNSFRRGQCRVNLAGVSEDDWVVVDLDKVFPIGQQGENQYECILFYFDDVGTFVVVPMALKGGSNAEALKAAQQLKGGAAFAVGYTPKSVKSICRPILFCNSISRADVKQLKNNRSKVHFRGKSFEIKIARCGGKLADVLS